MLHLELGNISSVDDLRTFLQKAIELEHATIPPYLVAHYSLRGSLNSEIKDSLREVAIEEMLHMTLAANILNAIGGSPRIDFPEFVPNYPSKLPLGVGSTDPDNELIVPLERFSKQLLINVFMEIEEPEQPREFPVLERAASLVAPTFSFSTIGEFYSAIKQALNHFGSEIFTGALAHQVSVHQAFGRFIDAAQVPDVVNSLETALRAVDVIVEQGEGTAESPIDPNTRQAEDYAHFYKFAAIYHGRRLRPDLTNTDGFSYSGRRIGYDPEQVYPLVANLKLHDLRSNSEEHGLLSAFNSTYSRMLRELDSAFNGNPTGIFTAISTMRQLDRDANAVVAKRISPDSLLNIELAPDEAYHLTPSFEYVSAVPEPVSTRFDRVIEILDESIGGPGETIGVHGAFWRNKTRDEFVGLSVRGLELIDLNNGAGSNLIKALRGEAPFGADLPNPPSGARFSRMPAGFDPVPEVGIEFIQQWIDDGCPEDAVEERPKMAWRRTNAPDASSRTDDIWFVDPQRGWAANSNGKIIFTSDGGDSWGEQLSDPTVYFRCLGFVDDKTGWAGTLTAGKRLFHTTDGGANWAEATNLPGNQPSAICGISVVNKDVVYASGTNFPNRPTGVYKTTNGGANWTAINMEAWSDMLIDCFFIDENIGWVVGGKIDPSEPQVRGNSFPVVLKTTDGGATWENKLASIADDLVKGEWGWKIQFIDEQIGFVSLEAFDVGAILKTTDGGETWERLPINDPQQNANLEGVGFIDENVGWVGGWGDRDFERQSSSATTDGGKTWRDANEIGRAINRFRFFGNPVTVGYSSGVTVYKYEAIDTSRAAARAFTSSRRVMPAAVLSRAAQGESIHIPVTSPAPNQTATLRIWDRFGDEVITIENIACDSTTVAWNLEDSHGNRVRPGYFILRLTCGNQSESSLLRLK
ncbi:ferritin-like domain-containing protein [Stieleria magnilauensis]|uniref:Ycf48-like protein n=1 Tax=Stieleria magnilauensis TaxID=2527963 RepID=A0ABX5XID1_9BACT|nr:Ycf48-like protein precursor [Planctomycetes bacterium TBK1r]